MNTLLCNGRVIDPSQMIDSRLDVLVQDGKILSLVMPGSCPTEWADKVIDASGMIVCPGFIDIHMHGDPIGADGYCHPLVNDITFHRPVGTVEVTLPLPEGFVFYYEEDWVYQEGGAQEFLSHLAEYGFEPYGSSARFEDGQLAEVRDAD